MQVTPVLEYATTPRETLPGAVLIRGLALAIALLAAADAGVKRYSDGAYAYARHERPAQLSARDKIGSLYHYDWWAKIHGAKLIAGNVMIVMTIIALVMRRRVRPTTLIALLVGWIAILADASVAPRYWIFLTCSL